MNRIVEHGVWCTALVAGVHAANPDFSQRCSKRPTDLS